MKPDFSGNWTLNLQASTLGPAIATSVRSGALRIEHHEPKIAVHLRIVFDDQPVDARFERATDGSPIAGLDHGLPSSSSARWDGDALVFTDESHTPGGDIMIRFRYELEDEGHWLRATEQIRGGGREMDNVWVFERNE